ncbi:GntR family transcriptional regulator [Marinihelvus fidelis]|nr:GntR family transcriptional regulator [Marinihelvus fidelis]
MTARRDPSLAEQAYDRLEEMLVTLALPPGESLREQVLAERLGMGRTPVREAVQKLASEGLLRIIPRKGLEVTPVDRGDLVRVLEVRRVLERLMVVKAAERATPDQRRALHAVASHLDANAGDLETFFRLDRRLNEVLARACRNAWLVQSLSPLHAHCRRLWYLHRGHLDLGAAAVSHEALARAVGDGDGAGAVRALNGIMSELEQLVSNLALPD